MIALVTGGSGGLGSAICRRLIRTGHKVAVGCFEHPGTAEDLIREELERDSAAGQAMALRFDVADPHATAGAIEDIVSKFGGLDHLVLAAANNTNGLLSNLPLADIERMHAVNVVGAMNCINAALPHLMASRQARIVLFSSVLVHAAMPGVSGYAATKGAIESLTRSIAVELGSKRITVNAIAPGMIDAGLGRRSVEDAGQSIRQVVPLRRAGDADEVATVVEFVLSPGASYLTGAVLPVDGGLSIAARTTYQSGSMNQAKDTP